ncbi:hypothetical protein V1517DRAFT_309188 [Lipomyces orientalis]|uniref:Uncharacterized protein n=1 Tax=Lipomyces orientalis TaxID=1233043 RepID=A0ACC3TJW1_9ASCO
MNSNPFPTDTISSTSLSSAMSHTLPTPNPSDPPTPYFYPTSSTAGPEEFAPPCHAAPTVRTPLPSPTGSPSPENDVARMLRNRRLGQMQQGKHVAFSENVDDELHLHQLQHYHVTSWEDVRQPWPSPSGEHAAQTTATIPEDSHHYHSHFTATVVSDDDYMQYGNEYTLSPRPPPPPPPPPPSASSATRHDVQIDILAEAAKRAEMEILASDISEMQF